uniref:YLP motif-containing protein 1 n=1 Tax=Salarias fasciatus TaxID=181472 RepID=A0A672GSA2_SALFA
DFHFLVFQEQQQLWYKKHLQNLQKLKQEKAKQNQRESDGPALPPPLSQTGAPPPPKEPPKSTPPPPPPKEEPPAPPPPPLEIKVCNEAARLQQLQAAAAQWQQVQQQRVGMQYQALMQQHEKLQQVLEKYQQVIQQPTNLQSMTAEMQLRHHEMQQQQFTPLFQEWDRSFALWYEQFQTYPHKDQLHDYEHQWKQWQEQMNATNAHLQERIATLSAMVPFAIGQYNSGMMGQFNQYPGQDMQMQQQSVNTGIQQSPAAGGPASQGGLVRGSGPTGVGVRPLGPQGVTPTSFNSARGPNGTNPRFDQPHQGFDGPPRFDQPQQRFDGPPRFDQPRHRFDGPPRFDQPKRFDGPPQRFDGPPRFDQPRHRFDGPPRFDQQRQRFDCPPRFDQPRFGQQPRFEAPRHPGPPPRAECPPVSQQTPKPEPTVQKPSTVDTKKPELSASQRQSEKQKCDTDNKSDKTTPDEDMTDDNLLGTDGFFVPNDPIPQTVTKNVLSKDVENTTSDGSDKPTAVNSDPSVPTTSATVSQNTVKNALKQDEPKIPHNIPKSLEVESPSAGNLQLRPEPPLPPTGRGRGQPPMPVQMRGRGRGQKGSGEFRGPSTGPLGEEEEEMSYDYVQPEESEGMPEEQENYDYEEPFYDEFGGEDSEIPREDIWMPDEHYPEEEYYEGGEPFDEQWEEHELAEYPEEGDPYWSERRPPMRGMRPPFPPGWGRPPRGHPAFMHPGRGRPLHPPHGPMDDEPLDYEADADDPSRRRMLPPPPREMMEEAYHDEMREQELGWQPPHGRGAPLPPHEIIDRGGMRRRPMGRGMARGMWHHGPDREEYKEDTETYVEDYNHGEGGHRWRAPPDYPPEEHPRDAKYHEYRERSPHERGYAPRMLPPEAFRDSHWEEERERERERGHPYRYDEHERGKGELRIHEYRDGSPYRREEPPYPPPPDWERRPRPFSPPERGYPSDYPDRPRYDDLREDPPLDRPAAPPAVTSLPESSAESQGMSGNLLALSQRQHEIILKAAQELKLIRELQEAKTPGTEPQQPAPADNLPELPAGLLGLEIPPEVRNVLKPGTTVERISYGERIVLRPDPVTTDRGYEKELLGPRDPYSRDPYYDRRSDPYMDRRDYARERESYREKPDYERERFERERYPPRERDDRSPLAHPLRSAYRERDRDVREKERSGSRDPEDHYGRLPYDRSSYERTGLDRSGPDRYGHSSSPYVERRSNPESRGPSAAPPLQPPPQPPPRIEKKPEIKNIDDILKTPGRLSRPERIVIIMRGLPGSGKSHVAKLIRDKEVDCGGAPPRVLVLDDYFMTEVEKTEKDPDTGKRVKKKVLEYEYEPEMEDTYRNSMLKTFKKTLDDGFFPFIILDTINDKVKHFDQFWSAAKTKGFEVYLAEITADTQTCAKRNVHGRTVKDITKMSNNWEPSPRHMVRLDVRSLLQDAAIEEVEMEDFNPEDEPQEPKREEEEEGDMGYIPKSKWEMDTSEAKLDKLDGLSGGGKRKRDGEDMAGLEDYLQLPDDYATRMSQPGKKRVRWADLEEQKDADRKRAIGFVVGQTDWERITDESGQLAQKALNRTKYF